MSKTDGFTTRNSDNDPYRAPEPRKKFLKLGCLFVRPEMIIALDAHHEAYEEMTRITKIYLVSGTVLQVTGSLDHVVEEIEKWYTT